MKPLDESSDKDIKVLTKEKAEAELQDICIRPLEQFPGPILRSLVCINFDALACL